MLQAVHVIHEEKIVHSDLKPANFVLVRGQLKLIDFGIANAIANDTTNIQRDHQVKIFIYLMQLYANIYIFLSCRLVLSTT
jgi:serine/threonine-protein kinase TTK/MPS1